MRALQTRFWQTFLAADIDEQHLDRARDQIGHRRSAALVRNVRHLDPEHAAQQLGVEMMECTNAAGAVIEPPLLRDLHEVGDAIHRQRGIDHQDERDAGDQRDRHQILARLVWQLLEDLGFIAMVPLVACMSV